VTSRAPAAIPADQLRTLEAALDRLIVRLKMPDDRLEYAARGAAIVLSGRSPGDTSVYPIARLRYTAGAWCLDWRRATERWSELDHSADVRKLVQLLETDPWGTFWG
jgi:hypothetical protein